MVTDRDLERTADRGDPETKMSRVRQFKPHQLTGRRVAGGQPRSERRGVSNHEPRGAPVLTFREEVTQARSKGYLVCRAWRCTAEAGLLDIADQGAASTLPRHGCPHHAAALGALVSDGRAASESLVKRQIRSHP